VAFLWFCDLRQRASSKKHIHCLCEQRLHSRVLASSEFPQLPTNGFVKMAANQPLSGAR